jgi:GTP pyrophosphokinase/guanosine-3',5'-bis(diphosphate) 3'-pyrophosphohydrolase
MFLDQVFVFTPKGRLVSLPRGAMPLDFAYGVHTNVGDTTVGAKINGELKPLRTQLQNGDVVEIVRGPKPAVPADWRSLAVTGRARSAIRRHIRQTEKEEFLRLGVSAMDQAFARVGKTRTGVSLRPALDRFAVATEDELFDAIGRGRIMPADLLESLFPGLKDSDMAAVLGRRKIESGKEARQYVRGSGIPAGVTIQFATCCNPVPGDRIVGIVADEKALDVHAIDCPTLEQYDERQDLWRDLHWSPEAERNTMARTRLRATIRNAPGVLGEACVAIGEAGGNIFNLRMHHRQDDYFDVDFDVDVRDARHATNIVAALRANPMIETVERARG